MIIEESIIDTFINYHGVSTALNINLIEHRVLTVLLKKATQVKVLENKLEILIPKVDLSTGQVVSLKEVKNLRQEGREVGLDLNSKLKSVSSHKFMYNIKVVPKGNSLQCEMRIEITPNYKQSNYK